MTDVILSVGVPERHRAAAVAAFWEAFRGKLVHVLGPDERALAFLGRVVTLANAVSAEDRSGRFLGMAGFKTEAGGVVGGGLADLAAVYGRIGGLWRGLLLEVLERKVEPGVLVMDGICVTEAARGRGVGTALLRAIRVEAAARDCREVRLDVMDGNPRAAALYRREGFVAGRRAALGPLRHVFGFAGATEMRCPV